jgi:hypothetical protein
MIHEMKIEQCSLCHILEGKKSFIFLKNYGDFQVGDEIKFLPFEDSRYNAYEIESPIPIYKITYALSDTSGMESGWIALSIMRLEVKLRA